MSKLVKAHYKLTLLLNVTLLLALLFIPRQAQAQWPPFRFRLNPSYQDGKITYNIDFRNQAQWQMTDVTINIPIPEGTRFLEADAPPATEVKFDGVEVSFLTALPNGGQVSGTFVVEIIETEMTNFSTYAWIAWNGEQPGDYLADNLSVDITRRPLNWERPPRVRLQLEMEAIVIGDIVTYNIYLENTRGNRNLRMWDLNINVPIPEGTTFISAQPPPPFVANFDGREVNFSIVELAADAKINPLSFQVSTEGVTSPVLTTHAWAGWKNWSRRAGTRVVAAEETVSGEVIVQPHTAQRVVADTNGDTPFPNYDLTGLTFQDKGNAVEATLHTNGQLCPANEPLDFFLYIDSDCQRETGDQRRNRGVEYEIRYRYDRDRVLVRVWDAEAKEWTQSDKIEVRAPVGGKTVTMSVPYSLIGDDQQFCWMARSRNRAQDFTPNPPSDWVPDSSESRLAQYKVVTTGVELSSQRLEEDVSTVTISDDNAAPDDDGSAGQNEVVEAEADESDESETTNVGDADEQVNEVNAKSTQVVSSAEVDACAGSTSAVATAPDLESINGKLAVPLDNGNALYDTHIFSLPGGQEIASISKARQPNFRPDGQRLLINREGGSQENVYEYDLTTGVELPVSDAAEDAYPFYNPEGSRAVYGTAQLRAGSDIVRQSSLYVQCSLFPPSQESERRCRDRSQLRLVPAGQISDIEGTHPVWTGDGMIAYNGCNTWAGSSLCGIYIIPSVSGRGFSDGFIPRQLTPYTGDLPADAKGDLIAFTSQRDGNWEAYIMQNNGAEVRNLSNSPQSNDGLPTISPDGNWVAFVSDRSGQWAIWVVPATGGEAKKLFDLPNPMPWGDGDRTWTNERISWGP